MTDGDDARVIVSTDTVVAVIIYFLEAGTMTDLQRCNSGRAPGSARKPGLRWLLLAAVASSVMMGCGDDEITNPGNSPTGSVEPTGGSWKTIVISSGSAVTLASPPADGSQQTADEIQTLKQMQSQRTAATDASVRYWDTNAVVRWNEIARQLVVKHKTNPPMASRLYALLSVAQYDALVGVWNHKYKFNRKAPGKIDSALTTVTTLPDMPSYPSEHAAIAKASAMILSYIYPDEIQYLDQQANDHEQSRLWGGLSFPSDIAAGDSLGRQIADMVIVHARSDRSGAEWTGTVPTGESMWRSTANPPAAPLLPMWGNVRPWLMASGSQFRPPAPPAMGSTEFNAALAEVRQFSDNRTNQQLAIAKFWADGAGTVTPPGHWNQIAADLIVQNKLSELRAARVMALMNMAVMDAGICCWDAKYTYWLIRPSQADTAITTPVGLPNFPSYTSGHSTFSGAAAEVLGYLFPGKQVLLKEWADEAAISRVYGGIHYRFDSDIGLEGGRQIGQLAIARGKADGSPK